MSKKKQTDIPAPRAFIEVAVDLIDPHPDNEQIFGVNEREQQLLTNDIAVHGVRVPLLLTRNGERYLCISGHRRLVGAKANSLSTVMAEIIVTTSPTYVLMLLVSLNVGRGFKDSYKLRLFKGAKQFLCQLRDNPELMRSRGQLEPEFEELVHAVHRRGVRIGKGTKTWKIIEALFGFSRREQDALTLLVDDDYRENLFAQLKQARIKQSKIDEARAAWAEVEKLALSSDLELRKAIQIVARYRKEILDAIAGKEKSKPAKQPARKAPKPQRLSADVFETEYGMLDGEIGFAMDANDEQVVALAAGSEYVVFSIDWLRTVASKA